MAALSPQGGVAQLRDELRRFAPRFKPAGKLVFAEHHQSHAASAFFPSPFDV
jgi:carbamoyltransferase